MSKIQYNQDFTGAINVVIGGKLAYVCWQEMLRSGLIKVHAKKINGDGDYELNKKDGKEDRYLGEFQSFEEFKMVVETAN